MRDPTDPLREQTAPAVHASPTAPPLSRVLTICLAAGVFLGLTGPLGTIALPVGLRLGYWIVAAVGGGLLGWLCALLVMRWGRARDSAPLMILAIAVLMTPPGTVLVWAWSKLAVLGEPAFDDWPRLFGAVFVISLAMTALNRLILPAAIGHLAGPPPETAPEPPPVPASPFLDRLPPRLRGATVYAVEAEDHYLRVHTDRGSDLILLRLSDALNELALLDGAQTHRSWWVARGAVRDVSRGDGRAVLTLEGGLEVPVSRAHAPALRAAGWF